MGSIVRTCQKLDVDENNGEGRALGLAMLRAASDKCMLANDEVR
jgi:hypothetical protein